MYYSGYLGSKGKQARVLLICYTLNCKKQIKMKFVLLIIKLLYTVLRIRSIFSDPDPGGPKRPDPTGSGSFSDMFMMLSKINCFMAFSYLILTTNDTLNQS